MKLLKSLILCLFLAGSCFAVPCTATRTISGRVLVAFFGGGYVGVSRAVVSASAPNFAGASVITNPFGYFSMTVPNCNDYTMAAQHKTYSFASEVVRLPTPHDDDIWMTLVADSK